MIGVPIILTAPGHRKINRFGSRCGIWTGDSQHDALVKVPYGIVPTQRTSFNPNHREARGGGSVCSAGGHSRNQTLNLGDVNAMLYSLRPNPPKETSSNTTVVLKTT